MSLTTLGAFGSHCIRGNSGGPAALAFTVSGLTGTYALNAAGYTTSGYDIYQFTNTAVPTVYTTATGNTNTANASGTMTVSATAAFTLYLLIVGAGGGGGSGDQGGGGGGAGEFVYQTVSLPAGTYSIAIQVGGGGRAAKYTGSSTPANPATGGSNGYGFNGNTSFVTVNGTTYNAIGGGGGCPARRATYEITSGYVHGGGAGCQYMSGACAGGAGKTGLTTGFSGGANGVISSYGGAGGGAGAAGIGGTGTYSASNPALPGGTGGAGRKPANLALTGFAGINRFFCGGGGGSMSTGTGYATATLASGGSGVGGTGSMSSNPSTGPWTVINTDATANTGSGGGGGYMSNPGGVGANGVVFIALAAV